MKTPTNLFNPLMGTGNYSVTSYWYVDGWDVTFGTARRGWAGPLFAVPNVTAHPSTVSVSITVLLYNGFNVPIKGLKYV